MKPIMMIVIDGASDRPDGKTPTPLESAKTPNLDKLVANGRLGLLYTVGRGVAPESDAGVFSLLGYDPVSTHLARGIVEAVGSGVEFNDGDLALRAGFATVEGDRLIDRRAGRNLSTEEAKELGASINQKLRLKDDVKFDFRPTVGHRAVVVFRSNKSRGGFSSNLSNFDPAYVRQGNVSVAVPSMSNYDLPKCEPLDKRPETIRAAALVNEFGYKVRDILDRHRVNLRRRGEGKLPANWVLMRDAGTEKPRVESFREKWGLNPAMIADLPVELGIGKLLSMRLEQLEPGTSTDGYSSRARLALKLVKTFQFVYVHLKGPDEPGHDGLYDLKRTRIEEIDSGFFSVLTRSGIEDITVCVACDHSTPWKDRAHSDDPVPLLITGGDVKERQSRRSRFTEGDAKNGELGTVPYGRLVLEHLRSVPVARP